MATTTVEIGEGKSQITFSVSSWFAIDANRMLNVFVNKLDTLRAKDMVDNANLTMLEEMNQKMSSLIEEANEAEKELRDAKNKLWSLEDQLRRAKRE